MRAIYLRHQIINCLPNIQLVDYKTASRELEELLRNKLVIVGDANKVLRKLSFRVDNRHLIKISRNSALRDALKHLIFSFLAESAFSSKRHSRSRKILLLSAKDNPQ